MVEIALDEDSALNVLVVNRYDQGRLLFDNPEPNIMLDLMLVVEKISLSSLWPMAFLNLSVWGKNESVSLSSLLDHRSSQAVLVSSRVKRGSFFFQSDLP